MSESQLSEVEKGRLLAMAAEPSRVKVIDKIAGHGRPVPHGAGQSIPGMLAMFVVMTVLIGGSETLTKEKYGEPSRVWHRRRSRARRFWRGRCCTSPWWAWCRR